MVRAQQKLLSCTAGNLEMGRLLLLLVVTREKNDGNEMKIKKNVAQKTYRRFI